MEPVLLLTRPAEASGRVHRAVAARLRRPIQRVVSPLFTITDVPFAAPAGTMAILTSEHGARRAGAAGVRGRVYCVGPRTAEVARAHGMEPITGPGDAARLLKLIEDDAPSAPLLHIHGRHVTGDVAGSLRAAGLRADDVVAYDQVARPLQAEALDLLAGGAPVIAPLFSTRTARLFAAAVPTGAAAPIHAVVIGEAVAAPLGKRAAVTVAQTPDFDGMVAAICAVVIAQGCG